MDYFSSGSAQQEETEPIEKWRGDIHLPDWPEEQAGAEYNLYMKDPDAYMMKKPMQYEQIIKLLLEWEREQTRKQKEIDDVIDDLLRNL